MANGYLIAAESDAAAIGELADGFGLDIIAVAANTDLEAVSAALAGAPNVGIVLSEAAAGDSIFVALLQMLAARVKNPQLILVEPDALRAFAFLPALWPAMSIEDARARAQAIIQSRAPQAAAPTEATPEPQAQEQEDIPEPAPVNLEDEAPASAETGDDILADKIEEEPATQTFQTEEPPALVIAEEVERTIAIEPTEPDEAELASEEGPAIEAPPLLAEPAPVIAEEVERAIPIEPAAPDDAEATSEEPAIEAPPLLAEPAPMEEAAPAPQPAAPAPVIPRRLDSAYHMGPAPAPQPAAPPPVIPSVLPPGMVLSAPNDGPSYGGGVAPPAPMAAREEPPQAASAEPRPEASAPELDMTEAMRGGAQGEAPASVEDEGPRRVGASEPPPVAPAPRSAPSPAAPAPQAARKRESVEQPTTAPADATAFAPRKLRRGEAELVRISIHQPKDLQAVIKAARKADPRTTSAPQSMGIGEVALGAKIGVALEVKGAPCDGALHRRTWTGAPLDFCFAVTPDADVKQVVIMARVFVDDAQIGVLAFTREVTGPRAKALPDGERIRLRRHKRVFLSYSSKDRETVAAIATAYQMAGVEHFWDRTSLTSGEIWNPRLRREIDRSDLFHLCWSKNAAHSPWVKEEAVHALTRKRRVKKPDITVQMLDGPPWAPHPPELNAINFDDFVRAAIVGYARGDGQG